MIALVSLVGAVGLVVAGAALEVGVRIIHFRNVHSFFVTFY